MWIFPEHPRSAAVLPLGEAPAVLQGWTALGLPETGLIRLLDEELCQLCVAPGIRPCRFECSVNQGSCSFCAERLYQGDLPLCVDGCPRGAIWIGNLERNNATNGQRLMRLSDLLKRRHLDFRSSDRRSVILHPVDG